MSRLDLPPGLFVTGTDTGVGKTFAARSIIAAMAERGFSTGAIKPVATGCRAGPAGLVCDDAVLLREATGRLETPLDWIAPLVYEPPLAPPVAARRTGARLSMEQVLGSAAEVLEAWIKAGCDAMVVEGTGGLLCPLADDSTLLDLAVAFDYPLVVVARRELGTLNHTLMTVKMALSRGLRTAGVVLNDAEPLSSPAAAEDCADQLAARLAPIPILVELEHQTPDPGLRNRLREIDWYERARKPRFVRFERPGPCLISSTSMPRDVICPSCGNHFPTSSSSDHVILLSEHVEGCTPARESVLEGSASDEFREPAARQPRTEEAPAAPRTATDVRLSVADEGSFEALDAGPAAAIAAPKPGAGGAPAPLADSSPHSVIDSPVLESAMVIDALGLGSPSSGSHNGTDSGTGSRTNVAVVHERAMPSRRDRETHEDDSPRGPSLPLVLLLSYASAMTLACGWLFIKLRNVERVAAADAGPPPIDTRPETSAAETTVRLPKSDTIPATHLFKLNEKRQIGSLEITPLSINETSVRQIHEGIDGEVDYRDGGNAALALRIRLKNASSDQVFAPLSPEYLRDRDRSLPDSFIETETGGRIYLFPLAVQSEWSIVGQEFRALKPGESFETMIVTAPDSIAKITSGAIWRLRLRVEKERTVVAGIRFGPGEVKRAENGDEDPQPPRPDSSDRD